jgi:hypothetical protein
MDKGMTWCLSLLVASVASKKGKDSEKFRALFLTINLHFLKISRKREALINRYCVDAENKKDLFKKNSPSIFANQRTSKL